jgi:hypothetical protein
LHTDEKVTSTVDLNTVNEDNFDFIFKTLRDEQMEPLIERRDQQRIEEIKARLMDGLDKYANPSTSTERNVGDAENMNEQKPIRSTVINNGDSSSTISSCDDMNVNDFNKISEQIWSDDEQNSDMVDENHGNLFV